MISRNLINGFFAAWQHRHSAAGCGPILIALLILFSCRLTAQKYLHGISFNNYRALKWSRADGLSIAKKNVMLKDINGFLWIISPVGLNRFDGSSFRVYYPDKNDSTSIAGAYSFSLVEDSLHNIWIGTNKGVSRFDIRSERFSNFSPRVLSVSSAATVIPFWATRTRVFCVEAGRELVAYDVHTLQKQKIMLLDSTLPRRTDAVLPRSVYDEQTGSVWMLTGEPNMQNGGIDQVLIDAKKTIHHSWPCFKAIPNHSHYSYGMRYDKKRNCIWINSVDGLIRLNLSDNNFHPVPKCSDLNELDDFEISAGIELDHEGNIWYSTNPRGILVYDPEHDVVNPLFRDSAAQNNISESNMSIYMDRDRIVWMGGLLTDRGPFQLIPFDPAATHIRLLSNHPVADRQPVGISLKQGENSQIWMGTDQGLNLYDPATNTVALADAGRFPGIYNKLILPLGMDSSYRKAWFYNFQERLFYETDLKTRSTKQIPVRNIRNEPMSGVEMSYPGGFPYRDGVLFLSDRIGIFYISPDSPVVKQVISLPYHITNVAKAGTNRLFLRLHFGFTNLGYIDTSGEWKLNPTPMDSTEWSCIHYDSKSETYWAGGVKQLYQFDKNFLLKRRYTEADGLQGMDELSLLQDDIGNIWFNNSEGRISMINAETGMLTTISEKEGYYNHSFGWATPHLKGADGALYFAGANGVERIVPGKIDSVTHSSVYLKKVEVNGKPLQFEESVHALKQLDLEYDQLPLSVFTGVIDYFDAGTARIRYKLHGLTEEWQYAPGNHVIRFETLPAGTYTLMIECSNSGNNFNGKGLTLLIRIRPAFWNTWWFLTACFISIALIGYALIRSRLNEKFRVQLELSEQQNQLAELRQKAVEMEVQALRAQMNPHFIFNSLNSINRFILQNNKLQASEYLTKFSRLIRLILYNSKASVITLESELDALRLYLDLECLRFNDHFSYSIDIEDGLDISVLKIPPLIIQPYAENAIWHGLMHKEDKGLLEIRIHSNEDTLFIEITDNGIGRQEANRMPMAEARDELHKALGMQITSNRITTSRRKGFTDPSVQIIDLVAPDGTPAGTSVLIKFPILYD
jgi:ligand-binding sensor domain-containing protein